MRFWGTPCFQTNRRRHPMSKLFFLPEDMLHDFPQWLDLPLDCRRKEVAIHLQTMQWWRRHRGDQRLVNPKWALRIPV
jgi:GTP-dependent phosphoenolpyruvate carboxykinase